jgi:hypothetical protein
MHRASVFAIVAIVSGLFAAPSFAGKAEDAFLASLVGSWSGGGEIKGGINGTMSCYLIFRQSSAGVHFSGSCDVEGMGGQSFAGDLTYNDKAHRYEAGSPTTGMVAGTKKGKGVAFSTKIHNMAGSGISTMTLLSTRIVIDVALEDSSMSKGPSQSHVTFTKQA